MTATQDQVTQWIFNSDWAANQAKYNGDKNAWYAANAARLQAASVAEYNRQQREAATQAPAASPAAPIDPTTPVPSVGNGAFGSDPVAMANLEQGIQNIMRDKGMTHDQAVAALNGPKSVESGTGLPKGVTFSPVGEQA